MCSRAHLWTNILNDIELNEMNGILNYSRWQLKRAQTLRKSNTID